MDTPWYIKMHDVCEHDEHMREWHDEHVIEFVCEHNCESVKHDECVISYEFTSLKTWILIYLCQIHTFSKYCSKC